MSQIRIPMIAKGVAVIRLILWVIWTTIMLIVVVSSRLLFLFNYRRGVQIRKAWATGFVWIFGFDVTWEGELPEGETMLYVSNHRASIDPFIQLSKLNADPVSRADLGNWPIIGIGARLTSIILVDKTSRESRKAAKNLIGEELKTGRSVFIYPEGGTKVAPLTSTFYLGSFEQAVAAGVRILPMVIEYRYEEDYWDHSNSAIANIIQRFGKWRTPVYIRIGQPISSDNKWTLLRESQAWMDEQIPLLLELLGRESGVGSR